eukprot:Em0014g973a
MSHWPPIEYGHIFCYFVDRPGVYTRQQMLQWKQLDAYNYFTSGFVRTVEMWDLRNTSECVILKALVNPSMKNPENAHSAWVATKKSGDIVAAHCTCMAGLGEGCSHVAAILFKVEAATRNGYTAITSSSCQWNEVFTTKHQPARIADIQFKRPKLHVAPQPANDTSPILATNSKRRQPFSQNQKMFFKGCWSAMSLPEVVHWLGIIIMRCERTGEDPIGPPAKLLPQLDKPHQAGKADALTLEMMQRHFPVHLLIASPTAIGHMSCGDPSSLLIKAVSEPPARNLRANPIGALLRC